MLALGGIAVVIGAVVSAMGLLALLGLPSSLIILEVVPFLVLAVGADNIFIFVQEYQVVGHRGCHGAGSPGPLGDRVPMEHGGTSGYGGPVGISVVLVCVGVPTVPGVGWGPHGPWCGSGSPCPWCGSGSPCPCCGSGSPCPW